MLYESPKDRRLRLTDLAIDVLLFKYDIAERRGWQRVVFTTFPKKTARQVKDFFIEEGFEASVHYCYGPTSEIVLYLNPSKLDPVKHD